MTEYGGGCHCGALAFTYDTALDPSDWPIRACQCAFCLAHDALSTSDPNGVIRFIVNEDEKLQRYRFGLKTADFLLCRECGVYIGAYIETENGSWAIVNTHALQPQPADRADIAPMDYEREDTGGRIARREERWTPASMLWP